MNGFEKAQKQLNLLDEFLSTKNLQPEERKVFSALRDEIAGYLEAEQKQYLWEAAKARMFQQLGQQTPEPFLGEHQLETRRLIPGSEGSGIEIQPELTPETSIRNFVTNPSYGDPLVVPPRGLGKRKEWEI